VSAATAWRRAGRSTKERIGRWDSVASAIAERESVESTIGIELMIRFLEWERERERERESKPWWTQLNSNSTVLGFFGTNLDLLYCISHPLFIYFHASLLLFLFFIYTYITHSKMKYDVMQVKTQKIRCIRSKFCIKCIWFFNPLLKRK
jgi:hypothetical protein